ncbi:peptidoglycan-binding domain-containing protein [Okeanomitos corallinicola TIOX110]|uniref:Peptidoglycan-binding domain-containing protein n=1 Tax=Okeanomitos corallinicola TIOX110 TaxID=3133117 RepID=A0ABZ2UT50_9CYAN
MKLSLTKNITDYAKKNHYYSLLLLSSTSLLFSLSTLPSLAAPLELAQAVAVSKINRPNLQIGSKGERVIELQAALKLLGFYTGAVDGSYQENTARAVYQFKQAAGLIPNTVVDAITWQRLFPNVSTVAINQPVSPIQPTASSSFTVPTQPSINRNNTTVIPKPKPTIPPSTIPKKTTTPPNNPKNSFQPTPTNKQNPNIQYTPAGWPILRLGNSGAEVIKLQTLLQTLGFLKGSIDGDFGVATEAAVKAAQVRYGLQPDGVVGGATWNTFLQRLR